MVGERRNLKEMDSQVLLGNDPSQLYCLCWFCLQRAGDVRGVVHKNKSYLTKIYISARAQQPTKRRQVSNSPTTVSLSLKRNPMNLGAGNQPQPQKDRPHPEGLDQSRFISAGWAQGGMGVPLFLPTPRCRGSLLWVTKVPSRVFAVLAAAVLSTKVL